MPPFDWTLPYPSRREPVMARNIVATSNPLAVQAGVRMLERGGNAMDAAIATAAALTVVEPTSNGIGGDAFALIWKNGSLEGLNGSGRSPRGLDADRLLALDRYPQLGWDPVTVPGCVRAWVDLHERHGRLSFADCLAPAAKLAEEGFLVAPQTARLWARAATSLGTFEGWRDTFLIGGEAPAPGRLVRLPDHARTLRSIAETRGESFYRGELAERMCAAAAADGGSLVPRDLEEHGSLWVSPISIDYRGATINEIPPNGQGIAALVALGILERFGLDGLAVDSGEVLHLQIEAMKLGFADAHRNVGDPDFLREEPAALLEPGRLEALAARIDPDRAQTFDAGVPKPGGTVYLATADAEGTCVSMIQSNYAGFGSGVVIPGTGIAMQNRGACFTLEAGHPNAVGAGKRPYHTIIPGMITPGPGGPGTDLMTFGVMGGFMQPQGHLQVVSRLRDFGQNPQAALDAPRWRWDAGLDIAIEPGYPEATLEYLRSRGHVLKLAEEHSVAFGRGQAIHRLEEGWCGGSDQRADGMAIGL